MDHLKKPTQDQINATLWDACDTFRGAFDSSEYKKLHSRIYVCKIPQ